MSGAPFATRPRSGARRGQGAGRRLLAAAIALAAGGAVLAGCTSTHDVLGSGASPCFKAVAVARLALHRTGRFSGVRPLAGTALGPALDSYQPGSAGGLAFGPRTALCLVAYRGSYDASRLEHVLRPGPSSATLAVVIVRQRDEQVVATILVDHPARSLARVLPAH